MDGGSTDNTQEILENYDGKLKWTSDRDSGAADAIQRGFLKSSGSILAWLSADDLYAPHAVSAAVEVLAADNKCVAVYGEGIWIDENGRTVGAYPTRSFDRELFGKECYICQPTVFFRRSAWDRIGGLDVGLHTAYDYDLWIRLSRLGHFLHVDGTLACSRMHRDNKTLSNRKIVFEEGQQLLYKHFHYVPVQWVVGNLAYLCDGRDQYFDPIRITPTTYLRTLSSGLKLNRAHPARFVLEWFTTGLGALARLASGSLRRARI